MYCNLLVLCLIAAVSSQLLPEPEVTETVTQIVDPLNGCSYTIHLRDKDGPIAKSVVVGTDLYHRIVCPPSNFAGCLVIYNCSVGTGRLTHQLLDVNGCSLEPTVIEHVEYIGDLEATIHAQAIRFNDDSSIRLSLSCQSKFAAKDTDSCAQKRTQCKSRQPKFLKLRR